VADIFVEESTDLTTFQNILLFLGGAGGIGLGVAVPYFYGETTTASEMRPNNTPCFVCDGTGVMPCRFCGGKGVTAMTLGSGEVVESTCVNCGGESSIVCTTCNGTGIQARYLDRREFADDD
jgi:RecJ-like exonuclease